MVSLCIVIAASDWKRRLSDSFRRLRLVMALLLTKSAPLLTDVWTIWLVRVEAANLKQQTHRPFKLLTDPMYLATELLLKLCALNLDTSGIQHGTKRQKRSRVRE